MHPAVALLGLAALGAAAFARGRVAACLACSLVGLWAAANVAWLTGHSDMIALLDLPIAIAAYVVCRVDGQSWQAWFAAIMTSRMVLHLTHPPLGAAAEAAFFHILNGTFLAACLAISWEGGADVASDCYRRVLRIRLLVARHS